LNGHPDEFRQLVGRYQGALLSFLVGRLGDRERAEEAAQESLVRAYFALRNLEKPDSFFAWLIGIADRVAREQQRMRQRDQVLAEFSAERFRGPEFSHGFVLEKAVAELADPYREVVLLRYYGERSCAQIAEQLAVQLGTITKRLSRAYAMLRESLHKLDDEEHTYEVTP
jgi:RNA polymerase sigma-70 factor (ECF subfamily)